MRAKLPAQLRRHLVRHDHADYSAQDHHVWELVTARKLQFLERYRRWIHPSYFRGFAELGLASPRVPSLEGLNAVLRGVGWRAVYADGLLPSRAYAELLSLRMTPVIWRVRAPEHVDYAAGPDIIHDTVGHLPMLVCPEYADYVAALARALFLARPTPLDDELARAHRALADLASSAGADERRVARAQARVDEIERELAARPSALTSLGRMFVWTVEFGLLGDPGAFTLYGAGLLSSDREAGAVCDGVTPVIPYSLDVIGTAFDLSNPQKQLFVARDFAQLNATLAEYCAHLRAAGELAEPVSAAAVPAA
jgi:phenylalanine-4-hydroxylase